MTGQQLTADRKGNGEARWIAENCSRISPWSLGHGIVARMARLGSAWVRPLSVGPGDLVDREKERNQLLSILEDYRNTAM